MAALRLPSLGTWFVFTPRSPFGAEAEVVHYNFLSRAISVLAGKISGIPILPYFDGIWGNEDGETIAWCPLDLPEI